MNPTSPPLGIGQEIRRALSAVGLAAVFLLILFLAYYLTGDRSSLGITGLLIRLWREWTVFDGWRGHSTHFIFGVAPSALLSPVIAAAAWGGLSAVLYMGLLRWRQQTWKLWPFALLFLLVWMILDARWQVNLWRQMGVTRQQYAGKTWEEKRLVAGDGALFRFVSEVKQWLPERPVRIFIVSATPHQRGGTEYIRLRTHYHLLPHNVYSAKARPPSQQQARTGDFILILNPIPAVRYAPRHKLLYWTRQHAIAAEPLYEAPTGSLYRVL